MSITVGEAQVTGDMHMGTTPRTAMCTSRYCRVALGSGGAQSEACPLLRQHIVCCAPVPRDSALSRKACLSLKQAGLLVAYDLAALIMGLAALV